jgi:hypothetical protein
LPAIFHQKIFTSAALVEYTEKRGCGEAAWEEGTMSLFDSWADRYIKRYGIDAFKKRMEERKEENRKEENEFRQHWDTWAPTGIACPRCGKELRLNEEEMPENYDPWT